MKSIVFLQTSGHDVGTTMSAIISDTASFSAQYMCKYNGIAEASPRQFDNTSLEQELEDRHNFLFAKMTMPVLFLQGRLDPGQHPEEYERTPEFVTNGRVEFIEGNHFFQLGAPDAATDAMRTFLSEPLP